MAMTTFLQPQAHNADVHVGTANDVLITVAMQHLGITMS